MPNPSRFSGLTRIQAGAVVAAALLAMTWTVSVALTQETLPLSAAAEKPTRLSDVVFYARIVERVQGGQGYYDALIEELSRPEWNFRPTSVFNWRLPTYAWLHGRLPSPRWGQALLIALAVITLVLAFKVTGSEIGPFAALLCLLLVGPFRWCVTNDIYLFTELWAGILIALSILLDAIADRATHPGRVRLLAVVAGIAALVFRELALPYCLLALLLALRERDWREAGAWCLGLGAWALFFTYHYQQVSQRVTMTDATQATNWVCFGGTAFILGTTEVSNYVLLSQPPWVTAIYLPLALLGLAGWASATGLRAFLTCVGYLAAFAVVGQPNNAYWGLMIAPLLVLGIVALPAALQDLMERLRPIPPAA